MNFAHMDTSSAISGLPHTPYADGPSWDHAKGQLDAAQEMEKALRKTVQHMVTQLDEASRQALTQFSQMTAVLTKMEDEQASSLTHRG
jgi:flagellar capping protein FliD